MSVDYFVQENIWTYLPKWQSRMGDIPTKKSEKKTLGMSKYDQPFAHKPVEWKLEIVMFLIGWGEDANGHD